MKHRFSLYLSAMILVGPACAIAQNVEPPSRAQVRQDLAELEQRGYNPGDWMHYPQNLRIAEERREQEANHKERDVRTDQAQSSRAE